MLGTWATVTGDWASQTDSWVGTDISPDAGSFTLSSSIPTSGVSYFLSVSKGDLTLATTAPISTSGHMIYPAKGDLASTFSAPSLGITYSVAKGDLTLSTTAPLSTTGHLIYPAKGALAIAGLTKWEDFSGTWAATSELWSAWTPAVGISYTFTVDAAGNLVITPGDAPTVVSKNPSYLTTIIIT